MISGFQIKHCKTYSVKCVVVGDEMVGKSCLLNSYLGGAFYKESYHTIFDVYPTTIIIDNELVAVDFWDTSGVDQHKDYRYGIYPQTDVFLMCFSLENRLSLKHVKEHWNLEVRHYCPNTPIILVGTRLDSRENNVFAISYKEGLSMAKRIGAIKYMECSAQTGTGLNDLFGKAVKAALTKQQRGSSLCTFI